MYMKKWIMICACVAVFQTALAQRITRQYNNVSFSAALKDLNARQHKYPSTSCMMNWRISG